MHGMSILTRLGSGKGCRLALAVCLGLVLTGGLVSSARADDDWRERRWGEWRRHEWWEHHRGWGYGGYGGGYGYGYGYAPPAVVAAPPPPVVYAPPPVVAPVPGLNIVLPINIR